MQRVSERDSGISEETAMGRDINAQAMNARTADVKASSLQTGEVRAGAANRRKTYDMAYIGIFTGLIAICSWISIPTLVPFTLQTFAVFLAVSILGGKRGTLAVVVYVLLGAIGVPVFAEFTGGIGIILRNTGGYIIGFIFSALIMWLIESLFGRKIWVQGISMVIGLLACYAVGTAWFMFVYMRDTGAVGLSTVLGWCVIPFVIPDAVKIALALTLSNILRKPLTGVIGGK